MAVKPEEGERGTEKYLREVMGIVEEKEQMRKTRRKEVEQKEGGPKGKVGGEGGDPMRKEADVKKRKQKQKLEKVLIREEEEMVFQGPLMVTKAFFLASLCLFLTSSALLLSDYKEKDSLALRQTVARLPSLEAPALLANLQPLASIAREAFVQVGWLGEDTWSTGKAGLLKLWERTEVVVANGSQLGGKLAEAIYRKVLVPALQWLQEPRKRGGPSQGHQQQQQQQQQHGQQQPDKRKGGESRTGFPPPSAGPTNSDMEKQMAAKIAATTAYLNKERERERDLNKEREQAETRKRKEEQAKLKEKAIKKEKLKEKEKLIEKEKEIEKETLIEKESAMEDFKRLQARRREAEGKR